MRRRTVLRGLAASAAGAAGSLMATEAARSALGVALDATGARTVDDWTAIADDTARAFYISTPDLLMGQLTADLAVLSHLIDGYGDTTTGRGLSGVAARLAVVMALSEAYERRPTARRWWATARAAADRSGDVRAQVWVGAWEVVTGLYQRRQLPALLDRADETLAVGRGTVCVGMAGVLAGKAQALAMVGQADEATATLRQLGDLTEALPAAALADESSIHGWPEFRLRYTQSWVYTHLGMTGQAYAAQDTALALAPPELARLRAQVEIQRAACLVIDGEVVDGLEHAHRTLDELPAHLHNAAVSETGRMVLTAVPVAQRTRASAFARRLTAS